MGHFFFFSGEQGCYFCSITSPKKHNVSFLVKSSVTQKGLKLKKESPTEFNRYELYEALQKKEELFQDHQVIVLLQ